MMRSFTIFYLGLFLLAACSNSKNGTENGENQKVFVYNHADGLSSLDPAFARNQANIWATTQLFNGLFELSDELYTVPSLVETWEVSQDGLTYIFKIKKDEIRFHDSDVFENGKGRKVTAQDFVYSFQRILDPSTASTGAWIFNDKVKKNEDGTVAEDWIKAVDGHTLEITLEKPFGPFLEILAMPYTYVVPKEAIEKYGKDFRVHPVGTGPFTLDSWDEGNSLVLRKNENYWRKDENGTALPYLDAVQVSFIADKNQELLTFQQNKLDFMTGIEASSVDAILDDEGQLKPELAGKFVVQKQPYLNTQYIGFMMDAAKIEDQANPFQDKRVRQAMNYAINREEMVSYLLNNLGTPGTAGIIPPAAAAFDAEKVVGYSYDSKKAAALLKEAGYGEGKDFPPTKLYTTIHSKPFVEYLQKQWAEVGINVEIVINPVPNHQELIDNGKVSFFRASWQGDYPDAENYLAMFYSKNISPSGPNKTHFRNDTFDQLYEAARQEQDGFKRFDIYQEMDKILIQEAPMIVLFYDEVLRLTQNDVVGLDPNPMNVLKLERADFKAKDLEALGE